jgi:hypothetical protein
MTSNPCRCRLFLDTDVEEFHEHAVARGFQKVKRRGQPYWWLSYSRCTECASPWLQAQEERFNDIYIVRRITEDEASEIERGGSWPKDLDKYEDLIEIGAAFGHSARFADIHGGLSVCIDLVGQRPDISAHRVAELLNFSLLEATQLLVQAKQRIAEHGYPYPWTAA